MFYEKINKVIFIYIYHYVILYVYIPITILGMGQYLMIRKLYKYIHIYVYLFIHIYIPNIVMGNSIKTTSKTNKNKYRINIHLLLNEYTTSIG